MGALDSRGRSGRRAENSRLPKSAARRCPGPGRVLPNPLGCGASPAETKANAGMSPRPQGVLSGRVAWRQPCPGASHAAFAPGAARGTRGSSGARTRAERTLLGGGRSSRDAPLELCDGISLPSPPNPLFLSPRLLAPASAGVAWNRAPGGAAGISPLDPRIAPASRAPNPPSLSAAGGGEFRTRLPGAAPPHVPHFAGIPGTSRKTLWATRDLP